MLFCYSQHNHLEAHALTENEFPDTLTEVLVSDDIDVLHDRTR